MLVLKFDILVFETLNLKGMRQLRGRKVSDLRLADFLLKVDGQETRAVSSQDRQWEPTSKTCHAGGHRQDIVLKMRVFVCGGCGGGSPSQVGSAQ